ncbi:Potassium transporter, partial [Dillenia turbinata]
MGEEAKCIEIEAVHEVKHEEQNQIRKSFRKNDLTNNDSFYLESNKIISNSNWSTNSCQGLDWGTTLKLAFQSIGIVYGDLGTSPLYVLPGVFPSGVQNTDDILGVLSLIIYSLTSILIIKYVFIVLSANDNGDGGTFALYSLLCRYAKVSFIPNQQPEDKEVSNYKIDVSNNRVLRATAVKSFLENSYYAKHILLFMTILGTSMIIGDGILTPCISVLSAVGGLKEATSSLNDNVIMWISVVILILLFQVQRFGTDKVGYSFAPILTLWFFFIGGIGLYNFVVHDPTVIKALNPWYIVQYFKRSKKDAWISLGGCVLCLTGAEALYADLGHFNVLSIQISTCALVFSSIILSYVGQASYLRNHPMDSANAFYRAVPKPMYWPMFVVAVLAAIIASQSLISASFSIVQQSTALGCFPRVKVVHTSSKYAGQVYVPEVNTLLMLACVGVTLGFKDTNQIGHAYGIAVISVFTLTSAFLILVMIMIWKANIFLVMLYALTIGALEILYFSSVLYKFPHGGYLPVAMSAFLVSVMYVWNYGYRKNYLYELQNKVPVVKLKEIASNPKVHRLPGLALFYTELVEGISPIFTHYISNIPALHSILVFITIKWLPIGKVPPEERFLFRRVEPYELAIFRCVVRYGYTDGRQEQGSFEQILVDNLKEFMKTDLLTSRRLESQRISTEVDVLDEVVSNGNDKVEKEIKFLDQQTLDGGITYLMGESEVVSSKGSSLFKRFVIDYAYGWLKRCVRQPDEVFKVPRRKLMKVGMVYE